MCAAIGREATERGRHVHKMTARQMMYELGLGSVSNIYGMPIYVHNEI